MAYISPFLTGSDIDNFEARGSASQLLYSRLGCLMEDAEATEGSDMRTFGAPEIFAGKPPRVSSRGFTQRFTVVNHPTQTTLSFPTTCKSNQRAPRKGYILTRNDHKGHRCSGGGVKPPLAEGHMSHIRVLPPPASRVRSVLFS